MSDTSTTDDEEQPEDYCNLDETEQYAFELGVKEVIREAVDDDPEFGKGQTAMIEKIESGRTHRLFDSGVYRLGIAHNPERNDALAAVADNPLIEIAELDSNSAILVHADYLNEYYPMMELVREEDEE
jgi:hypothetical protein